jgi:hypothetical protein
MANWPIFFHNGRPWIFKSNHPKEERMVFLDELPRDAFETLIAPNEPWDGVETVLGIVLGAPSTDQGR